MLIILGKLNGSLYFKKVYDADKIEGIVDEIFNFLRIENDKTFVLQYEEWQDGWARFANPEEKLKPKKGMLNLEDARGFLENIIRDYSN